MFGGKDKKIEPVFSVVIWYEIWNKTNGISKSMQSKNNNYVTEASNSLESLQQHFI